MMTRMQLDKMTISRTPNRPKRCKVYRSKLGNIPDTWKSLEEEVTEEVAVRKSAGKFHNLPTKSSGDIFTCN